MFSDKKLLEANARGLIHGPDESEGAFHLRVKLAKAKEAFPVSECAKKLFDVEPNWVHMRYSDLRLRIWEGGCTWIESEEVTLQLRKAFEKKTHYFGYSRDEILAHELVHVVRNSFEEPVFEEILAYQTSPSFFRRYFGPIFRSSQESILFVIVLCFTFFSTALELFQIPVYLAFLSVVAWGTIRLIRAQSVFSKTRQKMGQIVGEKKALFVMIRLTDREIVRFSKMEKEEILAYSVRVSRSQLRWRQIRLAYFDNDLPI